MKFFACLKEKHFTSSFAPCFDFNDLACENSFSCIRWFSTFSPFHAWLVNVLIIVSSENVLGLNLGQNHYFKHLSLARANK